MIVEGSTERNLVRKGAKLRERIERLTVALRHNELYVELEETKAKLSEVESELVAYVGSACPGENQVELQIPGDERSASVAFRVDYAVDGERALKLKPKLGEEWEKVFSEHIKINRARSFKTWMLAEHSEKIESLKTKVKECVSEVKSKASVTWRYGAETVK